MADLIYNNVRRRSLKKEIDFASDTFKIALLGTGYSPSVAHQTWSDISTYEVSGTGYQSQGKLLTGLSLTETNGVCTWTFTSPQWDAPFTVSGVRYAVIHDTTASQLIKCIDFGTSLNIASGPFVINVPASGVLQWA